LDRVGSFYIFLKLTQKVYLFRKCVGEAICKVDLVPLRFAEVVGERHFVVSSNIVRILHGSSKVVGLSVGDLLAGAVPEIVLALARHANLHSSAVKRRWFCEVTDVELYFLVAHLGSLVLHTEVEPLVMSASIRIHTHKEVVLIFFSLDYHVEITRLKVRVKPEVVVIYCWIHAYKLSRCVRLWQFNVCQNGDIEFI
jgi:hypothetical protein